MELKKFLRQSTFAIALSVPVLITGCDKDDDPVNNTITDVVVGNASFTTLEAAVVKAGLQTTLSGTGPFTVFAPDDAAFTASGITSTVLNSLTPAQVSNILLYHTLGAKVTAADVPAGPNAKVTTASGDSVFVTKNANGVFINGIKVNTADVAADNGVIHVIGRVLNPPVGNIVETAVASGLDSLVKAVTRATTAPGGDPTLAGTLSTARLTVFAPTNAAFTQLLGALSLTDINQIPVGTLLAVLRYHVVGGRAFSSDLTNGSLPMLAGGNTTTNLTNGTGGGPSIQGNGNGGNRSNITATNIVCRNGVVHLIDRVLLP
ncbi:MAG: fasciclin domain-containing protein [Chitinophagaceae bacterium]|nr:fasciclin domain-containing protein [Chitinophagaceae bacterium]MBP6215606.1 fasciclin domain-containing protein [Chitinophagaceae bacterium]HQV62000.1 fasciclin domain-containing protein [Chitinophagaceae bacterium]HQV87332.1 fasciclin domain-containing protein [Chitinophagaceae bacterium]HQX74059.1 fasciclin domain-containing protein [Chitinophagaceae bacterium]